ncbi:MAG: sigma-70 family RNA polymerase sigma factor [Calditrichia bacterium]
MEEDRQLIEKILSGNAGEFENLIRKFQRLVMHIVFRIIPNSSDQEDLCQEIFLKIYQNLETFRFESKLSTWIGRIAYNMCLNHMEKKKLPLQDSEFRELEMEDFYKPDTTPPLDNIEKTDWYQKIYSEIDKLPFKLRTILTLFHLDGFSYQEIGEIMSLPEGTVKSYLFRARRQLKESLISKYKYEVHS